MENTENSRVELPVATAESPETEHVSLLLIADGLRQAEQNLQEQETNIRNLTDQLSRLQSLRIASIAQKNLLEELDRKIRELSALS
jgi:sulfur relay (sulfurtransferase) DsrF/TusC family protein